MYRNFAVAAAITLAMLTGGPVTAQSKTRVVTYHDLDLTRPADVKKLRHRTIRAINYVCRAPSADSPLTGVEDQDCRAEVMAKVQPRMLVAIELAAQRTADPKIAAR
jgi:UrcA family protein